jgi:hypothetical protein
MATAVKLSKALLKMVYRQLGSRGGKARMAKTSKKDRHALAQKAAQARWGNRRKVASASTRNK